MLSEGVLHRFFSRQMTGFSLCLFWVLKLRWSSCTQDASLWKIKNTTRFRQLQEMMCFFVGPWLLKIATCLYHLEIGSNFRCEWSYTLKNTYSSGSGIQHHLPRVSARNPLNCCVSARFLVNPLNVVWLAPPKKDTRCWLSPPFEKSALRPKWVQLPPSFRGERFQQNIFANHHPECFQK